MKKILFFTSVLFFTLTVELFAQHPINLQVNNITDTSASLSWDANTCGTAVNLKIRTIPGGWQPNILNVMSPYILTGLDSITQYEWTVKCTGQPGWKNPAGLFTTAAPATLPIDSVVETTPIDCAGGSADVTVYITQPFSAREVQFKNYKFWTQDVVVSDQQSESAQWNQDVFGVEAGDYLMLVVDSTLFANSVPSSLFLHSEFVLGLNDSSILGYYYYSIDEPDLLAVSILSVDTNLCATDCLASKELTITGGTQPYNYTFNSNPTVNLGPQSYTINTAAGMTFSPASLTINVGDTVRWNNTGGSHNVNASLATFPLNPEGFGNAIGAGWTFQWVFTIAGTYNYQCDPHAPGMSGVIVVNPTPAHTSIDTVTNLCEGTIYNLLVSDAKGCSTSPSPTDITIANIDPIIPAATLSFPQSLNFNISCFGWNDGEITASATGGTGVFTYSDDGINFQSSPSLSGLLAGQHTITYKDANGCIETELITLVEPPNLSGTASVTDSVDCFEGTGQITFQVDPGNPGVPGTTGYLYSLDNGLNTQPIASFSTLSGDSSYSVMIEDNNGCQHTSVVYLSEPTQISYSTTLSNHNGNGYEVSCNGAADGMIDFTSTIGGLSPYQYSIDGGATFDPATNYLNLLSATYNVQVKDIRGCTTLISPIVLNDPDVFTLTHLITMPINCPDSCSGEISINTSNGIGQILYDIDGGLQQNTASFSSLCGNISYGSYTLNAVDENFCSATQTISLSEPTGFISSKSSIPEYCDLEDGQASITVTSGGTGVYSYQWNTIPIQDSAIANNLAAGTYTVTVTDGNSCPFSELVTVNSTPGMTLSFSTVSPCLGDSSGTATVTVTGGTSPYSYQWSDINDTITGETSATLSNMPIGIYSVNVTEDLTSCSVTAMVEIISTINPIIIDSIVVTNSSCFGVDDAQIEMFASGGQQPYSYSIYNGLTPQASPVFGSLAPNTYTLQVSDNTCFDDTVITLSYPNQLVIDSTVFNHISCFGADDGSVQNIQFIGGTGPFEFSIDAGPLQSYMGFANLEPGQHQVKVFDANNCVSDDDIIINEPPLFEVDWGVSNWNNYQIMCNNDSSGYIDITAIGGSAPYLVLTDSVTFGSTYTIDSIWAGNYTFIVEDANGCERQRSILFNEPSPIQHNFISTHVTCMDSSNGSLIDSVFGGVGVATSYDYEWNTGETTYSLIGIPIGTYIMTVKDENNCISVDSFTINNINALSASALVTNVSCYDYCDGVITTTAIGGSPNYDINGNPVYSYQWDDILLQNTKNAIGLCVDNLTNTTDYSCVITDGQGCQVKITQTINQEDKLFVAASILNEITCYSENDGKLTANITGGNGGDSFLWNNWTSWASNPSNTNLIAGNYVVIATDANGCTDTAEITLSEPSELSIDLTVKDIRCYGDGDGEITADADGGTVIGIQKYNYTWSNSFNEQIDISTALNLAPGIYTVTATDNNGCEITSESVNITESENPLTIRVDSIDESCLEDDGEAICIASGGTKPYDYAWTNGLSTEKIVNLTAGSYVVALTDNNGCEVTSSTVVNGFRDVFLPGNLSILDTTICLGESFFIDIQEKDLLTYEWENGLQQAGRLVTPTNLVNIYTLTITDPNCAPVTVEAIINVAAVPVNISTVNSSNEYTIHPVLSFNCDTAIVNGVLKLICDTVSVNTVGIANGSEIELFSDNNNCDTYNWTWLDDSSPTQSILVSPEESGWYFIDIEEDGCLGFDSIYVIVSVNPFDAITPNNDGFNDTWNIVGIEKYNNALVQVFNRWGAIVFETPGGQLYEPWDGTNNGKELPIGTYYYVIDLKNGDEPVSGPVTIIR